MSFSTLTPSSLPAGILIACLFLFSGCGEKKEPGNPESPDSSNSASKPRMKISIQRTNPEISVEDLEKEQNEAEDSEKLEQKTIYRESNSPDRIDKKLVEENGIARYSSKRLILYTDIEPEIAKTIPPLVNQLHDSLVEYFGELHPNREGTEFQVVGYLMRESDRFVKSKLLPESLPGFLHGSHRGTEFWMNDQKTDYYRRHLLFHEYVHCFMMTMRGMSAPKNYMEGMAELFGCHHLEETGRCQFQVFPDRPENFLGFGRIEMIDKATKKGNQLSVRDVQNLRPNQFGYKENYAWSWAYCYFLSHHPDYQKMFQIFGKTTVQTIGSESLEGPFVSPDLQKLQVEWNFFITDLCYDYELKPAVISFQRGIDLNVTGEKQRIEIEASRGWQTGLVHVREGEIYEIRAKGKFLLSENPKPWVSEPQGVSISYFREKPLGMLLATIIDESLSGDDLQLEFPMIPVGSSHKFRAEMDGTLYFRINDYGDSLLDNRGKIEIEIDRIEQSQTDS